MKKKDLKIDYLKDRFEDFPGDNTNVWINFHGIDDIEQDDVNYLAYIFDKNKKAAKLIINANEKVKEQLKVFSVVHNARFIK